MIFGKPSNIRDGYNRPEDDDETEVIMPDEFMDDENEVNLTLAEIGDATAFDESYAEWTMRSQIPLHPDALRTICRLWYGRGVARGTEWMESEVERITQEVKGGQQQ